NYDRSAGLTTQLDLEADLENLEDFSEAPIQWGFGPHFNEKGRSVSCVDLQEKYKDFNVLFIGEDSPKIYLTFDEGYENGFTPRILDILKEKEVKATFFITGVYYRRAPELIKRMIDEGHTVGSHSDKHIDFTKSTPADCIADLTLLHENIRKDFNYEMRCFRFPTGSFSQRSLELLKDMGYKSVFWSFGYKDWDPSVQMPPEEALTKLKNSIHPGEVLLLHPMGETNCTILGDFIDTVKEKGYEFASPV
ncbi:MAG: polysaccharide deacetylase family protein, partial [Oscillospiraceae bacterium]